MWYSAESTTLSVNGVCQKLFMSDVVLGVGGGSAAWVGGFRSLHVKATDRGREGTLNLTAPKRRKRLDMQASESGSRRVRSTLKVTFGCATGAD